MQEQIQSSGGGKCPPKSATDWSKAGPSFEFWFLLDLLEILRLNKVELLLLAKELSLNFALSFVSQQDDATLRRRANIDFEIKTEFSDVSISCCYLKHSFNQGFN